LRDTQSNTANSTEAPVGLSIKAWAEQVGIAPSSYYLIDLRVRPRQVRVGRRILIIEPPRAWLERMAAYTIVPTKPVRTPN
jgi:hypothetical protein